MRPTQVLGATGAIWKCACDPENARAMMGMGAVEKLVALLGNQPEVRVCCVRARARVCVHLQHPVCARATTPVRLTTPPPRRRCW